MKVENTENNRKIQQARYADLRQAAYSSGKGSQ